MYYAKVSEKGDTDVAEYKNQLKQENNKYENIPKAEDNLSSAFLVPENVEELGVKQKKTQQLFRVQEPPLFQRVNNSVSIDSIYKMADNVNLNDDGQDDWSKNNFVINNTFTESIDAFLQGKIPTHDNLKVCDTPAILLAIGFRQLPVLYTQKHFNDAIKRKNIKKHHHGMLVEQLKRMPEELQSPVMIYDSLTRKDSIIVVTSMTDPDNAPIIACIQPDGRGHYEMKEIESNFMLTLYGRENFANQVNIATKEEKIIYWNKEKTQKLFSVIQCPLPYSITNCLSNVIIRKSHNINYEKNHKKKISTDFKEKIETENENVTKFVTSNIDQIGENDSVTEFMDNLSKAKMSLDATKKMVDKMRQAYCIPKDEEVVPSEHVTNFVTNTNLRQEDKKKIPEL